MRTPLPLLALFLLPLAPKAGAVELNSLFAENAVLQQNQPLPVWGTGNEGESVKVTLAGHTATASVQNGRWKATFDPLPAGGPYSLTVQGSNTITVPNILIGEVWICSGQSNMERQLGPRSGQQPIENWEQEAARADDSQIRMYFVPRKSTDAPLDDAHGKWVVCSATTAKDFSAVGLFFAQSLRKSRPTPVGMIFTAYGGTPVEAWTSKEALESTPDGASLIQKGNQAMEAYPAQLAAYQAAEPELLKKYEQEAAAATAAGQPLPKKPAAPSNPASKRPTGLFNAMVAPLIPYGIRGVIWYQGESNGGRGLQYRTLFPLMIRDWRTRWQQGDFPFCYVQLASYKACDPLVREAQLLTLSRVPQTAMVVTTDVGDPNDIHPTRKRPVGERLALAARALAYHEPVAASGPLYESASTDGNRMKLHFAHAEGMKATGDALIGFEVAGVDRRYIPATATIENNTVAVSAPSIATPFYARYNWSGVTDGNLVNAAGLPASPFRTELVPDTDLSPSPH